MEITILSVVIIALLVWNWNLNKELRLNRELITNLNNQLINRPHYSFTEAEKRLCMDRLRVAENLVVQLPDNNPDRNRWLLNYGKGVEGIRLRRDANVSWDFETQSARLN